MSTREKTEKGVEGKRRKREEGEWIVESLKWPKTEEIGEKEGHEKGGRKGRPRKNPLTQTY